MDAVEEIIHCESEAEVLEEKADSLKWRAAELIHQQLEEGMSQRQLAKEIGKGEAHVRFMRGAWTAYLGTHPDERPPFNKAYQAAKRKPKQETQEAPPKDLSPVPMEHRKSGMDFLRALTQMEELSVEMVKHVNPKSDPSLRVIAASQIDALIEGLTRYKKEISKNV